VLEKYVEAIGGKAAIEKTSSRVVKGSFELPRWRHWNRGNLRQGAEQERRGG